MKKEISPILQIAIIAIVCVVLGPVVIVLGPFAVILRFIGASLRISSSKETNQSKPSKPVNPKEDSFEEMMNLAFSKKKQAKQDENH